MKLQTLNLKLEDNALAKVTAAIATVATFAKAFVPFYLIGSTPIFVLSSLLAVALATISWRPLCENAGYIRDALVVAGMFYAIVISSFLINSIHRVPVTHLIGILVFHALFLLLGFAAARAPKAIFALLLAQAAIYIIVVAQYAARFGSVMSGDHLQDIFGVGGSSDYTYSATFHQQIGTSLGLATIAALGLGTKRVQLFMLIAVPFIMLFMFHIAARTGIVALTSALLFWALVNLWTRSRRLALLSAVLLAIAAAGTSAAFYQFALRDKAVDVHAPDAISRTIREIQSRASDLRLPIWERTWQRIVTQPSHLVFGHGIGSFAIDEGAGPPDWLLRKTEGAKHYPHNVFLDMLYESGIAGLALFIALSLYPLVGSLWYWTELSTTEKSVFAIYVFALVSAQISGSFAYDYPLQFFLACALGTIGLRRKRWNWLAEGST
jgi:O-antigen ligase